MWYRPKGNYTILMMKKMPYFHFNFFIAALHSKTNSSQAQVKPANNKVVFFVNKKIYHLFVCFD